MAVLIALLSMLLLLLSSPWRGGTAESRRNEVRTALIFLDRVLEKAPVIERTVVLPRRGSRVVAQTADARPVVEKRKAEDALGEPAVAGGSAQFIARIPDDTSMSPDYRPRIVGGRQDETPYEQTRFNGSWTPNGGAVQQTWAFRSKAAHLLLSATGALDLPCTEQERRQRKRRCAGEQYDYADEPN
ncbi:hypothetical protein [Stenotrophomonas sp. MMGLT7]|uniref:hypothetical protein n=1 Tax=Stenotrophomonas sp. MMGLT7 TaxID=2901227 RepID=UPI001E614AEF